MFASIVFMATEEKRYHCIFVILLLLIMFGMEQISSVIPFVR